MKKLKYILAILFLSQAIAYADYSDIFIANIHYDWIDKSDVERESIVGEVRDLIFQGETALPKQKGLRKQLKSWLKDKDYVDHYYAASAGYEEYKDFNISAFYYKNGKNIYMYALQDKKDLTKSYYYDVLGHLHYVDFISGEYPDYPYYSIQYRVSGKPVSAIYFVSKDTQYMYSPKGKFTGLWYKHNMYDEHSKVILKRTTY